MSLPEERAEIEADFFLALLQTGPAAPRSRVATGEAELDVAAARAPCDDVGRDRLLVALLANVQIEVIPSEPALAQLVLDRLQVIDGHRHNATTPWWSTRWSS